MKRFFCTTCDKIKHVQKLPADVVDPKAPPDKRIGTCKWHSDKGRGLTRAQSMGSARVRHRITGTTKISAAAAKSKSKKG